MTHGCHIYAKGYDMAKATRCAYSQSYHVLPQCKCLWRCCAKFPSIDLPDQETDDWYPDTSPSLHFRIDHIVAHFTKHGRLPLTVKKRFHKCQQDTVSEQFTKIHTRKELVMIETTIYNFHISFYIPEIHKLQFHIPYVQIMGTNHSGDSCQTTFKRLK